MSRSSEPVEVYYDEFNHETILKKVFRIDGKMLSVPKSIIIDDDKSGTLLVPEWWAFNHDLI